MITKWREDHMRNDSVDEDTNTKDDFDCSGKIGGVIKYINSWTPHFFNLPSIITRVHKLVLFFKFFAALGKMEIPPFSRQRITKYLEHDVIIDKPEYEYFTALLT